MPTTENNALFPIAAVQPVIEETPLTETETAEVQAKLWTLFCRQSALKTQGDSASMREEEAAELLDSALYTLRLHLDARGLPARTLLTEAMPALFAAAQQTLLECLRETESLYGKALRDVRTLGSHVLAETLKGIGGFFKLYDYRLYAQRLPAMIDYPLCFPVPETLRGVVYLREYLKRLLAEYELVACFSEKRAAALLFRACPGYRDMPVNLYEPVAAVVTGLSLLGGGETLLEITGAQAGRIASQIAALSRTEARALLRSAAADAGSRLPLSEASRSYLVQAADALYPRLAAGAGSAAGVFCAGRGPWL
jgi:hypothetical protein